MRRSHEAVQLQEELRAKTRELILLRNLINAKIAEVEVLMARFQRAANSAPLPAASPDTLQS